MGTTATARPLRSTFAESPRGLSGDPLHPGLVARLGDRGFGERFSLLASAIVAPPVVAGAAGPGPASVAPGEGFAR